MVTKIFDLNGKKAIITGGSRGIGKAAAEVFNEFGVETALIARSQEVVLVSDILCNTGVKSHGIQADISNRDERRGAFKEAIDKLGTVDILINNAGIVQD